MPRMKPLLDIKVLFVALFVLGGPCVGAALGQTSGTISGVVQDETDSVLPGVTITIRHLETGVTRVATTDEQGRYRVPALGVGSYEVEGELAGFQTVVRQGVTLAIGREAVVDLQLKVSELSERVIVAGEAPLVNSTTSVVSGTVTPEQMRALPLNARSFLELVPLVSGAVLAEAGAQMGSHGFGKKLSVAGTRYVSNLFLLDGAVMNDFFGSAGSAAGTLAGVETVREFRVITNAFDSEYGRHTGGVISAVTKSGTNAVRGSLFGFLRNDALDARNFFDRDPSNPERRSNPPDFSRYQFGAAVGGPLRRDRTFIFGSFEGLRESLGRTRTYTVPGLGVRGGVLMGNTMGVNPAVRPFLDAYPVPNTPDRPDGTASFITATTQLTNQNFWTVRLDHNFSGSDMLFARLTIDDAERTTPGVSGFNTTERNATANRYLTVEETHIFSPSVLSRTHFSVSRTQNSAFDLAAADYTFPMFAFGGTDDVPGRIIVSGLTTWGGNNFNPKLFEQTLFQFKEDLSLSRGRHAMRFGFYGERIHYDLRSDVNAGGNFTFSGLADFMRGIPSAATFIQPGSDNIRNWRTHLFALYLQDDINVRPGLTVNLGLRYEFMTTPKELNGKVAGVRDLSASHIYTVRPDQTDVGDPYFENPSLKNFAPRFGVAWSPFENGKGVLRSGWGIFHEQILPNYFVLPGVRAAPFYSTAELASRDVAIDFPNAYNSQVVSGLTGGSLPQIDGFNFNPDQPTVMKWNVDWQQELGASTSVTVGYAGSRGENLMRGSLQYNVTPSEIRDGRRFILIDQPLPNPYWNRMRFAAFDGSSEYHSLQLSLQKRFSAGLQVGAGYTFSRAFDDSSTIQGGADFGDADREPYAQEKEWARAAFDVPHSFYTSFVYDLPGENLSGLKSHVLGGWGIAGLVRLNSGFPMNITADRRRLGNFQMRFVGGGSVDLIENGDLNAIDPRNPNQYFDVNQFTFPESFYLGNVDRNAMRAPGIATVDFTLTKNTRLPGLGSSKDVQLRFEVFNLFNRANFGTPASNLFTNTGIRRSNAGEITTTTTSARQIQLALKFTF